MNESVKQIYMDPDQLINYIVTNWMKDFSGSDFKVVMLIYFATIGNCVQEAKISLEQSVWNTGLTKNTVIRSLNSLVEHGHILKFTHTKIHTYALNYVSILGPGSADNPVQKYHILYKKTPRADFIDADKIHGAHNNQSERLY